MSPIAWLLIHWILLGVIFVKISNSLISHLNSLSDLIQFEEVPKKYLNSPWIWPLFTTILSNWWLFLEIDEFGTYFDTSLCVFNDLMDSSRHSMPHNFHKSPPKFLSQPLSISNYWEKFEAEPQSNLQSLSCGSDKKTATMNQPTNRHDPCHRWTSTNLLSIYIYIDISSYYRDTII